MSFFPKRLLFYAEVLSLDICIGVVGSGALAKTLLAAEMKLVWWFLLPASVWVVYTADHLFDARKVGANAVNARHKFHFEHFIPLAILAALTAIGCALCAFIYLREWIVIGGLFMVVLAVMHVVLAYWGKIRFGKEISVAAIYTCGVWFAPFMNRQSEISGVHIVAILLFFLSALLNLFMNSVIEFRIDRKENQVFGMQLLSPHTIRKAIITLSGVALLVIVSFTGYHTFAAGFDARMIASYTCLLLLCATPGVILLFESYFAKNQRYRFPAEWIFASGIFLLFIKI